MTEARLISDWGGPGSRNGRPPGLQMLVTCWNGGDSACRRQAGAWGCLSTEPTPETRPPPPSTRRSRLPPERGPGLR
eukprot:218334-Alexandrium_andersonii.AAC.1